MAFSRLYEIFTQTKQPGDKAASGGAEQKILQVQQALQQAKDMGEMEEMSLNDFSAKYSRKGEHGEPVGDPFAAKYADEFFVDPNQREPNDHYQRKDFRLNKDEYQKFKKNGFVVSERLGNGNFTDVYYKIYSDDLPVFITADSVLHAWHRSYEAMLGELEVKYVQPTLITMLADMHELLKASTKYGSDFWNPVAQDVDVYLAVARSVLNGRPVSPVLESSNIERCKDIYGVVNYGEDVDPYSRFSGVPALPPLPLLELTLFGSKRMIDQSFFTPRGHYATFPGLTKYFRAMTWLGYVDFRIAGGDELNPSSPQELAAVLVMHDLLTGSGSWKKWNEINSVIQTFVGFTDSMNFLTLEKVLEGWKFNPEKDDVLDLQKKIEESDEGKQSYGSHGEFTETPDGKANIPRSFVFIGQCFFLDNWVASMTVKDKVSDRRIPSCLDVAFSVFGNNQVTEELVRRMDMDKQKTRTVADLISEVDADESDKKQDDVGIKWRDGINYCAQLHATKQFIDDLPEAFWEQSIVFQWLKLIRTLSNRAKDGGNSPKIFQTEQWGNRILNTQLGSYTELRHDTILYAKPQMSMRGGCSYPEGYVEPNPMFWKQFEHLLTSTCSLLLKMTLPDQAEGAVPGLNTIFEQMFFLQNFSGTLKTIYDISVVQSTHSELSDAQKHFLKTVVESQQQSGTGTYSGWYCDLFYKCGVNGDASLVTDLFTDPPDQLSGDHGCIIHNGTGTVSLMIVSIDDPKSDRDAVLHAGPIYSHYEFAGPTGDRWEDIRWSGRRTKLSSPVWVQQHSSHDNSYTAYIPSNERLATDEYITFNVSEEKNYSSRTAEDEQQEELKHFKVRVMKSTNVADIKNDLRRQLDLDASQEISLWVEKKYEQLRDESKLWECRLLTDGWQDLTYQLGKRWLPQADSKEYIKTV